MCERRSPGVGNDFEHKLHLCGLSWFEMKYKKKMNKNRV